MSVMYSGWPNVIVRITDYLTLHHPPAAPLYFPSKHCDKSVSWSACSSPVFSLNILSTELLIQSYVFFSKLIRSYVNLTRKIPFIHL